MQDKNEELIHRLFNGALWLKIFNSFWQIILGFIILFDRRLKDAIFFGLKQELGERPGNFFAAYLERELSLVNHVTEIYIGSYLLIQGLLKILLIMGLFKKKLWVYPVTEYIFFFFIFYQLYRFNLHHSHNPFLILLSTLDIITILLIDHEKNNIKAAIYNGCLCK